MKEFKTCKPNDTLGYALQIFSKVNTNIIPIVNENSILSGLLTKNKVIQAMAKGDLLSSIIHPYINYNPICLSPEYTVLETRKILLDYMIGHAPVVNEKKEPIGIISTSQILYAYEKTFDMVQSQLKLLFDSLHFGLFSVDKEMRITAMNPLAKKILNNKHSYDETNYFTENKELIDLIKTTITTEKELPRRKLNVSGYNLLVHCYPLTEREKLIGAMVIMDDLTNIETIIKELQISKEWEEKLRTVVELAYDAIVLVNEQGNITMANKGFCELLSVDEKNIIGTSILKKEYPDLCIQDVLSTSVPINGIAKIIDSKQCLITNLPIKDNEKVVGAVCKITFRGLKQLKDALNKVSQLEKKATYYKQEINEVNGTKYSFADIIGNSTVIAKVKKEAMAASQSRSTVLLIGESGTGKELFAHGIHAASSLPGAFIKVNCAAIPEELLESEFFGYVEGAFTGAKKGGKKGKFELAQNGTLFLDEIGDMPLNLQTKLLRVLQEKELEPIGSNQTIQLNTRIIAATNQDLEKMVKSGDFREDLYYRLNILQINIPSLRERKEDIPDIVNFIIKLLNQAGFDVNDVTPSTMSIILNYNWPGNIRELQNVLERAANLTMDSYIDIPQLPEYIFSHQVDHDNVVHQTNQSKLHLETLPITEEPRFEYRKNVNAKERELIIAALHQANGNKSAASKILGISRPWLYEKIKKYNINFG
ncbi:sigma 54-interacting transcriptional regulator [Alkalihalobacterium alkalinitrilicum]|uniref:sigma 54-interacting transcriptional regulator n=1 Tax=Alkalihalobacterium alkalinitrilicum TaxID=427920 RepID=UPI001C596678|nr:sigma-54-dependent Fis family transcriptional regulator [Alkalihalobacterium alkalinitrilicum]